MLHVRAGPPVTAFDPAVLARQTGGDRVLEREVLRMFLDQAPADFARLSAASPAASTDIAHRIKGAARAIGAEHVATAAARIETVGTATVPMARLRTEIDTTCRAIARHLGASVE